MQTGLKSGMGPPITYQLDGKQYVALMGGIGAVIGNAGPQNTATTTLRSCWCMCWMELRHCRSRRHLPNKACK